MAGVITELAVSRMGTIGHWDPSRQLAYAVTDTEDDTEIDSLVQGVIPAYYKGLKFGNYTTRTIGGGIWFVTVNYGQRGLPGYTFDTTGSREKITQAKEHLESYGHGVQDNLPPPDYQGAIGVTDDGVEGVEITLPRMGLVLTRYYPPSFFNNDFQELLRSLTGTINDADFGPYLTGEVLFLGATGTQRGLEDGEVNYRFEISKNVDDLFVASIGPIQKGGWDYLWIRYESYPDTNARRMVKRPQSVHRERVYDFGDFSQLPL